jgi:hypothetical protein
MLTAINLLPDPATCFRMIWYLPRGDDTVAKRVCCPKGSTTVAVTQINGVETG